MGQLSVTTDERPGAGQRLNVPSEAQGNYRQLPDLGLYLRIPLLFDYLFIFKDFFAILNWLKRERRRLLVKDFLKRKK